jgi:ribulose-phosphate 3-epimerase
VVERALKIAPSIASANQRNLSWVIQQAQGADLLHFDIEDGVFIPNLTFGPKTIADLRPESALPFDVHLEVQRPEDYLEAVVAAGADFVTIQVESTRFPYQALQTLRGLGVRTGLALNASTGLEALSPVLHAIDVVHLMTAEPDGVFLPGLIEKVRGASNIIAERPIEIEVDGGVSFENAPALVKAGASILVAGRAIWGTKDPAGAIERLRQVASPG